MSENVAATAPISDKLKLIFCEPSNDLEALPIVIFLAAASLVAVSALPSNTPMNFSALILPSIEPPDKDK